MPKSIIHRYLKYLLKTTAWLIGILLSILILLIILIQIPIVQDFAKDRAVSWLGSKLKTKVSIDKLRIHFPNQILIEKVYFEDQQKDSLLWTKRIAVDIALFKLFQNKLEINSVELEGFGLNIKRKNQDTAFNFSYILQAFSSSNHKNNADTVSSKPLQYQFGKVLCKDISLRFSDDLESIHTQFALGKLETAIDKFDIEKSIYGISDLNIEGLQLQLNRAHPLNENKKQDTHRKTEAPTLLPEVRTGKISLKKTVLKYNDAVAGMHVDLDAGDLFVAMGKMDLNKLILPIEEIKVSKTNLAFSLDSQKQTKIISKKQVAVDYANISASWKISAQHILLDSNQIRFDNNQFAPLKKGVDYQHLLLTGMGLKLDSVDASPASISGKLKNLQFSEKSGLQMKSFRTDFYYSEKQARLDKLYLQTAKSVLSEKLVLKYASINSLASKPENIDVDIHLKSSKIAVNEMLLFAPMLDKQFNKYRQSIISVNAEMKGQVKNLRIPKFEVVGIGSSSIKLNGLVQGLPKMDRLYADLKLSHFRTTKTDLESFIPPSTLPNFLRLPERIMLEGNFKGGTTDFKTNLRAETSDGNANVDLQMLGKEKSYQGNIVLDSLNLGRLFKQEKNIGKATLTAKFNGAGFDYKTMNLNMDADLLDASIKEYHYKNLLLKLQLDKGDAKIISSLQDSNITYQLNAYANLTHTFPAFQMNLDIDTINLKHLNLVNENLAFHGHFTSKFENSNPDSLEGNMLLNNMHLTFQNRTFSTDSIWLDAHNETENQILAINSRPVRMYLKGKYRLTELPRALEHTFNQYYQIPGFKDSSFEAQNWKADFNFSTSPLVLRFMPALEGTDTIKAQVIYNSIENDLRISASAPLVQYDHQYIKKLKFNLSTGKEQMNYHLGLWKAGNPSFAINETTLDGFIKSNTAHTNLIFRDKNLEKNYQIAGSINESSRGIELSLDPDSLLLNKQKWVVKSNNLIRFDTAGIYARDFQFQFKDQSIALNSLGTVAGSPLKLEFIKFDINTLTDIAKKDSLFADGIINGNLIVRDLKTHPSFTTDINIANLAYQRNVVGDLVMKVDNIGENSFNANLELKGIRNQATIRGTYQIDNKKMDLQFKADSLDLSILKPFSMNQLKDASGNLKASVGISGSFDKPSVNGALNFQHVLLTPTMLGQTFKLDNDEVEIDDRGVHFKNFSLDDSLGNKALLNGSLLTKNYKDFDFDLKLNADDFNLINSTQADNQLFFGKLNMDANIKITGNLEAPVVNAKLQANKNTNLTVVMPGSNPEIQSREGVVNFIDKKKINDTLTKIIINDSIVKQIPFSGLVLNTVIETDTAAIFSLVLDSQTGDALTVQGKTSLAAARDESGKLSLTGLYEVERGAYQFSLNMLKKRFEIVKGSTITWTGDPLSALVDIKAMYKLKASPIDLVEQQLVGQTPTEVNKYKQRIPVEVYLKMKEELMKPQISFDIIVPEQEISKWPLVDDKLQKLRLDESEMNKQVFALLILGRFVGEDLMQNNTGTTTTGTMVRQSVSGVLSSQLNRVAGGLIKGVDLNFDFESQDDYSSGSAQTRTDLKVGMSRTLKNDRIKVNVGTNVPIEGSGTATNASYISSDVQVDYMLSKDGKYMLRTYSKNKYEGVIEGQIVETGVTFIFTVEYDKFKEIFRKNKSSNTADKLKKGKNVQPKE